MHQNHKKIDESNRPQIQPRNNNKDSPLDTKSKDPITEARKDAIYAAIMNGSFDIRNFVNPVPQGSCVYHANEHLGGSHQCSALRRIFAKAEKCGIANTSLDAQLYRLSQPHQHTQTQQQQTNRSQSTTKPPISANRAGIAQSLDKISVHELHDTIEFINTSQDSISQISNDNSNNNQSQGYHRLKYFCRLITVNVFNTLTNIDNTSIKILVDSGASHTLINTKELFTTFHDWADDTKFVTLADSTTTIPISGSGTITAKNTSLKIL